MNDDKTIWDWDWQDVKGRVIAVVLGAPILLGISDLATAYDLNKLDNRLEQQIAAGLCSPRAPCESVMTIGCKVLKEDFSWLHPVSSLVVARMPAMVVNQDEMRCYKHSRNTVKFVALPGR